MILFRAFTEKKKNVCRFYVRYLLSYRKSYYASNYITVVNKKYDFSSFRESGMNVFLEEKKFVNSID